MINIMELDHNSHSVFLLYYHLVMVNAFWSQSFCLLSAGGAPIEAIRQYIESQGEKNEPRRKNKNLSK